MLQHCIESITYYQFSVYIDDGHATNIYHNMLNTNYTTSRYDIYLDRHQKTESRNDGYLVSFGLESRIYTTEIQIHKTLIIILAFCALHPNTFDGTIDLAFSIFSALSHILQTQVYHHSLEICRTMYFCVVYFSSDLLKPVCLNS